MAEFCPGTGRPCVVDEKFEALRKTYADVPETLTAISAMQELVNLKRKAGSCDGIFIEQDELTLEPIAEHCDNQNHIEMTKIASIVGDEFGLEPELYVGITARRINVR